METLVNPYYEKGKRLMARKVLYLSQFCRLVYLEQANSFWSARYDQPYTSIYGIEPPYEKLKDRYGVTLATLSQTQFLMNWLRSYVLKANEYETNAFIHLKTLETLLAQARKNEEFTILSKVGAADVERAVLCLKIIEMRTEPGHEKTIADLKDTLAELRRIQNAYKYLRDGFQIPDPSRAIDEALRLEDDVNEKKGILENLEEDRKAHQADPGKAWELMGPPPDLKEIQEAQKDLEAAKIEYSEAEDRAQKLYDEGETKKELLEESFKKLTKYILFLRASRVVIEAVAQSFEASAEAWLMKPERLKELEDGARKVLKEITLFATRIEGGRRQTLEEAQEEAQAFENMEGGPDRLALWDKIRKGNYFYYDLPEIGKYWVRESPFIEGEDAMSLWETKNFWRPKALELKRAIERTFKESPDITRIKKGYKTFMESQSDLECIYKLCGISEEEG